MYGTESFFVWSSSTVKDDFVICLVVTHGAVGSMRRDVSSSLDLSPIHGESVEGPKVVHVSRVSIAAKIQNSLIDEAATVAPSG